MRPLALRRRLARLARDTRGTSIIEFAVLSPVMVLALMGLSDLAYQAYVQASVQGAILKAGRDASIQGGAQRASELDERVMSEVRRISRTATYTSTRRSYASFSAMRPEPFTDRDGDGVRDSNECYEDVNGNRQWDPDPGATGQGGANDTVMYTMTVTYPRLFPTARLLGWSNNQVVVGRTILKNQPYASQTVVTVTTICT